MRLGRKQLPGRSLPHRPVMRDRRALIRHQHQQGRDILWLARWHRCADRTIIKAVKNDHDDDLEEDAMYVDLLENDEDGCSQFGDAARPTQLAEEGERGESSTMARKHQARKTRCRAPSPASITSGSGTCTVRVMSQLQPSSAKTSTRNDLIETFLKDLGLGANTHITKFHKLGIRTVADLRTLKGLSLDNGNMVRVELLDAGFSHLQYMQVIAALQKLC